MDLAQRYQRRPADTDLSPQPSDAGTPEELARNKRPGGGIMTLQDRLLNNCSPRPKRQPRETWMYDAPSYTDSDFRIEVYIERKRKQHYDEWFEYLWCFDNDGPDIFF